MYFSNHCDHSKKLLQTLAKTGLQDDMHFISIDNRIQDPEDGNVYVVLENGSRILLPRAISRVPAIFLVSNKQILFGDEIYQYLQSLMSKNVERVAQSQVEPEAFSFGGYGAPSAVMSDQFSFLDMNVEDYAAKGGGGMRQLHNYVTIHNKVDNMSTSSKPMSSFDETKVPSGVTVEQLQKMREQEFISMSKG